MNENNNPDGITEMDDGLPQGHWSERLMILREAAEDMGKTFAWDCDWPPIVFVEGTFAADTPGVPPEMIGKSGTLGITLPDNIFDSVESKNLLADTMTKAAVKLKAVGMTFISTIWVSKIKPHWMPADLTEEQARSRILEQIKDMPMPADDPNHIEGLMMLSVYLGGEDDGTKTVFATIKREEGKSPVLCDWKLTDDGAMGGFIGRFPEAIYKGLKLAAEAREREAQP